MLARIQQFPLPARPFSVGKVTEETRIALMNYDWLINQLGLGGLTVVELRWDRGTIETADPGADAEDPIDELCRPGYTLATTPERLGALLCGDDPATT